MIPRLVAAIEAKAQNPNVSLREALGIGGFQFPTTEGRVPAASVFDSDNVSLAQRKNQLSRRLRQLREKEQEEKGNESDKKDSNANEEEGDSIVDVSDPGEAEEKVNNASISSPLKRSGSMDIFSEMVSNLPSINDFDL